MHLVYQHEIGPVGTALYYSLRYCSPHSAELIRKVFELSRQLDAVLYEVSEPSVARAKLAWWRSEIEKLLSGQAVQHPLMVSLQKGLQETPAVLENPHPWHEMVDGVEMDLAQNRFDDLDDLEKYLDLSGGSIAHIISRLQLDDPADLLNPALREFVRLTGQLCQYVRLIRNMPISAMQNRIYVPATDIRSVGLTARNVLDNQPTSELLGLVRQQCARALEWYWELHDLQSRRITSTKAKALMPILIRMDLSAQLAQKMHDHPQLVLDQRAVVTPVRKVWKAYLAKRRGLKGSKSTSDLDVIG